MFYFDLESTLFQVVYDKKKFGCSYQTFSNTLSVQMNLNRFNNIILIKNIYVKKYSILLRLFFATTF